MPRSEVGRNRAQLSAARIAQRNDQVGAHRVVHAQFGHHVAAYKEAALFSFEPNLVNDDTRRVLPFEPDGVAEHAVLLPFSDLRRDRSRWTPALERRRGKKLLLYCQSGGRSGMAAARLRKEGFDAINLGSLARCQRGAWVVTAPNLDA